MAAEPRAWVVDASVAFAWFVAVPGSEQAALLLAAAAQFDWLAHRASEPFSALFPAQALLARAEQQNATLITADQRLLRKLQEPHPGLPASLDLAQLREAARGRKAPVGSADRSRNRCSE
jgi:hypothetical protein